MKKTLLITSMIMGGVFGSLTAQAASNVTLYGIIDIGVAVQKAGGQDTTVNMKSGTRSGSRWGIKGVEDLGNGYSVGFILEQGFNSDDGSVGNKWKDKKGEEVSGAFNRESKLYVQGDFGQIGFGRLGSLAGGAQSNDMLTGWALGTSYDAGSWTNFAKGNGRLNNAVAYVSPEFAGFKLSAMYSNGTDEDGAKWSDNIHYYGIGAQYTLGGFKNSLIFEAVDNKGVAATANSNTAYLINLGLGYDLGSWTPMFAYQYNWQDEGIKDHVFGLSSAVKVAGGTAKLGARYLLGKNDGAAQGAEDKRRAWTLNAAYEYPLSKRTLTYAYAGYADGSKALKKDVTKAMSQKDALRYNGFSFAVGVVHNF